MSFRRDSSREEDVGLPVLYESWPQSRDDLESFASGRIRGLDALEEVLVRNDRWGVVHLPFSLLRSVLERREILTTHHFCDVLLPWLARVALRVEHLFKEAGHKVKNLYTGRSGEVLLTRRQVCCLLSLAFFNSFEPQEGRYNHFTLSNLLCVAASESQRGKLLCLLSYFERIRKSEEADEEEFLSMCVSVSRRRLDTGDAREVVWKCCEKPLVPFQSLDSGVIESAHGCLQVDFANAYIGGGVLRKGCVQEEIRFMINPECLVSILFCERMNNLESILIMGAEQFSSYTGYSGTFTYTGPYEDTNPIDSCLRRCVSIVAIDATRYSGSLSRQFQKESILRELNKAYCGFTHRARETQSTLMTPVATGNWGCGAFGGNKPLKTLIQWLAASRAGREVKYYTFKDTALSQKQREMTERLLDHEMTVGQLYELLISDSIMDSLS